MSLPIGKLTKKMGIFGYGGLPAGEGHLLKHDLAKYDRWADAILPADAEAGAIEQEVNRRPLIIMAAVGVVTLGILVVRLVNLQIVHGGNNLGLANGNRIRQVYTRAPRGVIYDRNHQPLVTNEANYDLVVTQQQLPSDAAQRQALYAKVGGIVGLTVAQVQAQAEAKNVQPDQPHLVAANLTRDQSLLIDQTANTLPGFELDINPIRRYQDGGLLSNVLGYIGRVSPGDLGAGSDYLPTDYIGKTGLELQYESQLRGVNGSEQTEVDAQGRPIKALAERPAVPGNNLVLSVDQKLQANLTQNLQAELAAAHAQRAAAVALDPRNGEVLTSVSLPGYDDNLFANGISQSDYTKLLKDPGQPLFNKVIGGLYPSGSIIKPVVASAALDEHVITPDTTIVDQGKLVVQNPYDPSVSYTYFGWEHTGLGAMTVRRAIAMSSDIFFYTVAGGFGSFKGMGINQLASWYQKYGLGSRTGVDLPNESTGRVPTPDWKDKNFGQSWYTGDTYNVSIGQGDLLVTPLQMAVAIGAIANGGTVYEPHFVKQILDSSGGVVQTVGAKTVRTHVASPSTLQIVREGMRQAVTTGTACCLIEKQVPVPVAAKTGTAETDPAAGKNPDAWFEAFAPYDNPQIVVVALIENAPGEGATFAAPVVRNTLAWYFGQH